MSGYIKDNDTGTPFYYDFNVNLTTIDGYTPKNKKCFCYPYNQIVLINNCGGQVILKPELLEDLKNGNTIRINYNFILSVSPSVYAYPTNYRGLTRGYQYSINFTNFPVVPFKNNTFDNWYALNKNSVAVGYIQKATSTVTNGISGNVGGLVSDLFGFAETIASQEDMRNRPDIMNGVPQGNDLLYSGAAGVFISQETCRLEYIVMIDEYFTHYGYLINETRRPLLQNRINFDYIKTRDINIVGDIPQEDINELESLFNNGLTIWHNHNTFGDYSVANNPRG